ncbi:hypothetical protein QJQ45_013323 [Haematococcus lacustris]|nr:hypothetical protein QJQ45_013323 [Haematococcus lacustris]
MQLVEEMAEVSMKRHNRAKQLVVLFGAAGIGTRGGWGADAALQACWKVVCRPRGTDQRRGRVVLVDEHCISRVSSPVYGQQPCESQLNKRSATRPTDWKPQQGSCTTACCAQPAASCVTSRVQGLMRSPGTWSQQRDQPVRGMMWCPVVAPRKPPQAPCSSQEATPAAASEPWPNTPPPAQCSKRTKAEQAAEPTQPTKAKARAKAGLLKPSQHHSQAGSGNLALNQRGLDSSAHMTGHFANTVSAYCRYRRSETL